MRPTLTDVIDAVPPSDLDAESAVLGSLLIDPAAIDDVGLVLSEDDFYGAANAALYRTLRAMHDEDRRIDTRLLMARLKRDPEALDLIGRNKGADGATAYLGELVALMPTAAYAGHYAAIVRDKSTLRKLRRVGETILQESADPACDPREALHRCEQRIFGLLGETVAPEVHSVHDVMLEVYAAIERGRGGFGLDTGFPDLTQLLGGMRRGELIVLAARPGMGKTALALNIAAHVTKGAGVVYFASLEMSQAELGVRLLAAESGVPGHKMHDGFTSAIDRAAIVEAQGTLSRLPLWIDDAAQRSAAELASAARRIKRKQGLALVVVDYLQLVLADGRHDNRQEAVASVARRLKGLARELDVPVLCLAQLNRQSEATADTRPKLSHLRESGAIEQDADVVLFIYREDYYRQKAAPTNIAEIWAAKNRNGPAGEVAKLGWFAETTQFKTLARAAQDFNDYADARSASAGREGF